MGAVVLIYIIIIVIYIYKKNRPGRERRATAAIKNILFEATISIRKERKFRRMKAKGKERGES